MRIDLLAMASALALLGVSRPAVAQENNQSEEEMENQPNEAPPPGSYCPPGTVPTYQSPQYQQSAPPYQSAPQHRHHEALFSPYQTSISIGGGVANFWRDRLADAASHAGAWDLRLTFGTRSPIAFEAGYLGTGAQAHDTGVNHGLITTQVFGALRFNLTVWRIQPFIFGGAGWVNLHKEDTSRIAAVTTPGAIFRDNANGVAVPMGGGIASYIGKHGLLEARFTYDLITTKDFTNLRVRPDLWIAELRVGYAF